MLEHFNVSSRHLLRGNDGGKKTCGKNHLGQETAPSSCQLKCDGTCAETRVRLSTKRTSPFKSAGGAGRGGSSVDYWHSRGVRISGSNAGHTVFRGSVKGTGYPLHSPVSPSLPLPWVNVCHHISTGVSLPSTRLECCPFNCKVQFWYRPVSDEIVIFSECSSS